MTYAIVLYFVLGVVLLLSIARASAMGDKQLHRKRDVELQDMQLPETTKPTCVSEKLNRLDEKETTSPDCEDNSDSAGQDDDPAIK